MKMKQREITANQGRSKSDASLGIGRLNWVEFAGENSIRKQAEKGTQQGNNVSKGRR